MRYPYAVNVAAIVASPSPSGPITFTDWPSIPRVNAFVEIANTKLDLLWPQVGPQFRERGSASGFSAALAAWIGAVRVDDELVIISPGGHGDSVFSGVLAFNYATFRWRIALQPSDYTEPVWQESIALWAAAGIDASTVNPNHSYLPNGDRVWKDLKQTGMHSYGTQVNAQEFGIFHLRDAVRHYDKATWTHTRIAGPVLGADAVDGRTFYSPSRKMIYLMADLNYTYGQVYAVDPTTGTAVLVNLNGGQWWGAEICPIEGTEKIVVVHRYGLQILDGSYRWKTFVIDFATMTQVELPPRPSDPFASDPLITVMHSNKTGLMAMRSSGGLSNISLVDGTITDRGDSGIPASVLRKAGVANGLYGRLALVTIDAGNQGFVLLADHDENVRVMAL